MELYIRPNTGELTAPRLYQYDENTAAVITGFHGGAYFALGYDAPQFEFYHVPKGAYVHTPALYDPFQKYWYAEIPSDMLEQAGALKIYLVLPDSQASSAQRFKTIFSAQVQICGKKRPVPSVTYNNAEYEWGEEQG